eukprot:scaffold1127_cov186-Ochromonas_danica.AAC.6
MGGMLCCIWRMWCCDCTLFEKQDDWSIDQEIRPGERGAGFLYKRAKSSAMWKRDRAIMKGEIILAGAVAVTSTTRPDTKKKFYFNISHPQCGLRELYTKTRKRRAQWIDRINEIALELSSKAVFGKLLKQGGLSKNIWQERWCICAGSTIDYFESATDNQSKGSLVIAGATITPTKIKDKYCFEVASQGAQGGKKANKKYVFGTEKEHERDEWVIALRRAAREAVQPPTNLAQGETGNPLAPPGAQTPPPPPGANGAGEDDGLEMSPQLSRQSSFAQPSAEMKGYLLKKSPNMMKGWQKRYFVTQSNGDMQYFKSVRYSAVHVEDDQLGGKDEKGIIRLVDVQSVELNEKSCELIVHTVHKAIVLKASNLEDTTDWARNINAWLEFNRQSMQYLQQEA